MLDYLWPSMNTPLAKWLVFSVLALTWGSSFILMKRGLISFDFFQVGLLRISFAALVTLSFAWRSLKEFRRKDLKYIITVGLLGNGIPYFLFPIAVTRLDSSLVGILNSLVPLFTIVIGAIFFKISPKKLQFVGIFIGLLGAVWLLAPWQSDIAPENLMYGLFPIIATIQYAISINIISQKLTHLSSNAITLLSFLSLLVPAVILLFVFTDFVFVVTHVETALTSLGYIAVLGAVGSSIAVVLFNMLIKSTSALFASSITYCVPIVAAAWGFLDGEQIGTRHLVGILFILLGVYLVNAKKEVRFFRAFRVR